MVLKIILREKNHMMQEWNKKIYTFLSLNIWPYNNGKLKVYD